MAPSRCPLPRKPRLVWLFAPSIADKRRHRRRQPKSKVMKRKMPGMIWQDPPALGADQASEKHIHHIVHRREDKPDGGRNGKPSEMQRERSLGQIIGLCHMDRASAGVSSSYDRCFATIRGAGQTMRRACPKVHHGCLIYSAGTRSSRCASACTGSRAPAITTNTASMLITLKSAAIS